LVLVLLLLLIGTEHVFEEVELRLSNGHQQRNTP